MFGDVFKKINLFVSRINFRSVNLFIGIEVLFCVAFYTLVFYEFRKFHGISNFYGLLIESFVILLGLISAFCFVNISNILNKFVKDLLRLIIIAISFFVISLFHYKLFFLDSIYTFIIFMGIFFFVLKPFVIFLFTINTRIRNIYDKCDAVIVLEKNFSSVQIDILKYLIKNFSIKYIINYSNIDVKGFGIKYFQNIEQFSNVLLSVMRVFKKLSVRKIIYVAAAPDHVRIKDILSFATKFNMQAFRTQYLESFVNANIENVSLIPFSFKDFETEINLSVENKHFLIGFFRGKNIWITYNGEDIIFEFIQQIVKSGVGFINIFVSSSAYASMIEILLREYKNVSFSVRFDSMDTAMQEPNLNSPDYIFYSLEVNDTIFSVDNFLPIIKKNFLLVKNVIDVAEKVGVTKFFLISDVHNAEPSSWVYITQRLSEMYLKSIVSNLETYVIRIPKSSICLLSLEEIVMSQMNDKCFNIPVSLSNQYLTSSLLNIFIKAISIADRYKDNILNVKPCEDNHSLEVLVEILLNTKGIKMNKKIQFIDEFSASSVDEFLAEPESLVQSSEKNILILESFRKVNREDMNNLFNKIMHFMNSYSIPEIVNLCLKFGGRVIQNKQTINKKGV